MLVHRLRCWHNLKPALGKHLVFSEIAGVIGYFRSTDARVILGRRCKCRPTLPMLPKHRVNVTYLLLQMFIQSLSNVSPPSVRVAQRYPIMV